MNTIGQKLCAWAGPFAIILFFVGFWPLANFFPPLSPTLTAVQVASLFRDHSIGIRFGAIFMIAGFSFLLPFYALVSVYLKRIEGEISPLSHAQMMTAVLAVVPVIPAAIAWCAATYRPERGADLVLLMNDYGWLMLFMVAMPAMVQFLAIGIAVLGDRSPAPVLPRWFGYFTLWCALLGVPGNIIVLFKTGPFAWTGLFGFYIPATLFGVWTFISTSLFLKIIGRDEKY